MTDSDLFNIDETLNKVYKELASHQSRLDSFEQHRLEMVSVNRILSLLPRPVPPTQVDNNSSWDFQEVYHENNGGEEDRLQYPSV